MAENERHAEANIELPPESIWPLITDARAFHGLFIPHTYNAFDQTAACQGMEFQRVSLHGHSVPQFIVDWDPPRLFSFGHSPTEWVFWFQLQPIGEFTKIRFARRFRKPNVLERAVDFFKRDKEDECQQYTNTTIRRIVGACANFKKTGGYGITLSS